MATDLTSARAPRPETAAVSKPLGVIDIVRGVQTRTGPARGSMVDAQALLVFDFGRGRDTTPCRTNVQLAAATAAWPELPVLAQREVAGVLARQGRIIVDLEDDVREQRGLGPSAYVTTAHVADAAAALLRQAGWDTVGVLAHPCHAARCIATVEAAGLRCVAPATSMDDVGFDPTSTQWWTRNRRAWLVRELAVMAHTSLIGLRRRRS